MAATLGLTRYGLGVEFLDTNAGEKTSKTYQGFNFVNDDPDTRATQAILFVRGGTRGGKNYVGLAGLLAEDYSVNGVDVIARNAATGTVGGE